MEVKIFEQMAKVGIRRQNELARLAGISQSNLSNLMQGNAKGIHFSTLEALCDVLSCTPGDLLEYVPNDKDA